MCTEAERLQWKKQRGIISFYLIKILVIFILVLFVLTSQLVLLLALPNPFAPPFIVDPTWVIIIVYSTSHKVFADVGAEMYVDVPSVSSINSVNTFSWAFDLFSDPKAILKDRSNNNEEKLVIFILLFLIFYVFVLFLLSL
jgi:hypothetical protein